MRLALALVAPIALVALLALVGSPLLPGLARAQEPEVVVGVPIRDGRAGEPRPGVIIPLEEDRRQISPPIALPEVGREGKTSTVSPQFGGGYRIETQGEPTTTVRPRFGGGYTIEQDGEVQTEVRPQFGGGYEVERAPGSPLVIIPAPVD